jgi:cytochrome c
MAYGGEKDPARRADIIAYLRTLSDTPAPLPTPAKAP